MTENMAELKVEESEEQQPEEENTKEEDDKDPKTLLSLLQSWDVETYLEQQEERAICIS